MSQKTDMEQAAKDTLLSVTGTPPDQLRGLTVAFNDFVTRSAAIPLTSARPSPPPEVKSSSISFPSAPIQTNEQPMAIQQNGGGGSGTGGSILTRMAVNSGGTIVASTVTVSTP